MNFNKLQISIFFLLFTSIVFAQNSGTFIDERDEHEYNWVKIGSQTWMAENLAWLPNVSGTDEISYNEAKYYVFNYNGNIVEDAKKSNSYKKFGAFYNYEATKDACPCGYKIPKYEDWIELLRVTSGNEAYSSYNRLMGAEIWDNIGYSLKSNLDWETNLQGIDEYGFNVLPSGVTGVINYWGEESGYLLFFDENQQKTKFFAVGGEYDFSSVLFDESKNVSIIEQKSFFDSYSIRCIKDENPNFGCYTDERDGKVYKTVKIGDQTWMAENLAYGDPSGYKGCDDYGLLYSNYTNFEEVCPEGWHVPSEEEWRTLINFVDGFNNDDVLKSKNLWNGIDSYGFNIIPAGSYGGNSGQCVDCEIICENKNQTDFWTKTFTELWYNGWKNVSVTDSKIEILDNGVPVSWTINHHIRCIKDEETTFNITGKVLDIAGNPIANATITIIDKQNKAIIETVESDSQGNFAIEVEDSGNPLMLSVSKYAPTNNKRFVTKNIDITSGEDFNEDIHLTAVEGYIVSGWFPDYTDICKNQDILETFLNDNEGIFNELNPCIKDLEETDGKFNIGFSETWKYDVVKILHNEDIQVIPTIGYIYNTDDDDDVPNNFELMDKLLGNGGNTEFIDKLVSEIVDFTLIEGVDGFEIDFESFTSKNREGYSVFIEKLQEGLESYNKVLTSTIQLPWGKKIIGNHINNDHSSYSFDYIRILNNIHNVKLMCYDLDYDFPHSQCPIVLPEFLTGINFNPFNDKGFQWTPTLRTIIEMILDTRTEKNLNNINFALPTYGKNYVYNKNKDEYNEGIPGYYEGAINEYLKKTESEKKYRMEFGCDITVKSDPLNTPENWYWWYQDSESIKWRLGYLNENARSHVGVSFWQLTDLPPDFQTPFIGYKNKSISYPETNEIRLTYQSNEGLKSSNGKSNYINLEIITPSGRVINQSYWDAYTIENSCPSCDSAFFEILAYGDTTVIKITDYYPEEGEYQILLSNESDSVGLKYMNLNFINNNDTTVLFEKHNVVVNSVDTIGVVKNLNTIVTKLTKNINICNGYSYNGWTQTGKYSQIISSTTGADSVIITTNLTVHDLPNPDFTFNTDTLASTGTFISYQWYNQDGAIDGATFNRYLIRKSGTYYLEVMNENHCSAKSAGIDLIKTGIVDLTKEKLNLIVIPNPNDGKFRLRFENGNIGKYQVQIFSENGQVILNKEVYITQNTHDEEFGLTHLPKGNYFIKVFDGEKTNTKKVILK